MILMGGSPDKSMGSASGQALLAHELTHVAQATKGLHRKATFSGGMPFAEEHEVEAEAVEQSVEESGGSHDDHGADTRAATNAALRRVEDISHRVQDIAAEAARTDVRNGSARRVKRAAGQMAS